MNEKMKRWKKEYEEIAIPDELGSIVDQALQQKRRKSPSYKWIVGLAASAVIFTAGVNSSPTMAKALSEVPVIGKVVEVLVFKVDKEKHNADIIVPAVNDLENKTLENSLNERYLEEGKALYAGFMAEMEEMEKAGGGHLAVDSGYEVKTNNDQILSIARYVTEIKASAYTTIQFDTIDKKNQILLSLPILFKDDSYVATISENIKQQMRDQMKLDEGKIYWVADAGIEEPIDYFEAINKDQNFYINHDGRLVISFDEYEVAPGYMGVVEFEIPTKVISEILVGSEYIK